jgi:hypothetical protein
MDRLNRFDSNGLIRIKSLTIIILTICFNMK